MLADGSAPPGVLADGSAPPGVLARLGALARRWDVALTSGVRRHGATPHEVACTHSVVGHQKSHVCFNGGADHDIPADVRAFR